MMTLGLLTILLASNTASGGDPPFLQLWPATVTINGEKVPGLEGEHIYISEYHEPDFTINVTFLDNVYSAHGDWRPGWVIDIGGDGAALVNYYVQVIDSPFDGVTTWNVYTGPLPTGSVTCRHGQFDPTMCY